MSDTGGTAMTTLLDHLRAWFGEEALEPEIRILVATDARAARLPRHHGVLYSPAVDATIAELAPSELGTDAAVRSAYYFGLQVGWRVAQRLR
jgi:hypothetical protein